MPLARLVGTLSKSELTQTIAARAIDRDRHGPVALDPTALFDSGLTGVETVDRWPASVIPTARRAPSRVYSDVTSTTQRSAADVLAGAVAGRDAG